MVGRLHYYAGQRVYNLRNKVSESIGPQIFLLNQHCEDPFPRLGAFSKFEPLGCAEYRYRVRLSLTCKAAFLHSHSPPPSTAEYVRYRMLTLMNILLSILFRYCFFSAPSPSILLRRWSIHSISGTLAVHSYIVFHPKTTIQYHFISSSEVLKILIHIA